MQENTLFYSRRCQHCKNFILQLKANNLLDYFSKKICIDDPIIRRNLPPFLKEVPTIITDDYDKPIASDMAFKWITYKVKEMNKPKAQPQQGKGQPKSCSVNDPSCFSFDNTFDNFGVLDNGDNSSAYQGLGDTNNLKKGGKGSTGSINYESFAMITPEQAGKKGSTGSIDYDSFSLGGGNSGSMQNNQVQSGQGGSDEMMKRMEKLQKTRAMDNNFFGDNDKVRS
jgi:hypothetical protein